MVIKANPKSARSKTKSKRNSVVTGRFTNVVFDGSSTEQAPGELSSDCLLKPVFFVKDPPA